MGTAIHGVDVVCKADDNFVIAVVILHCNFCGGIAVFSGEIENFRMDGFKTFFLMKIFYEAFYAAFIMKNFASYIFFVAFIGEIDSDSCIKESLFAKTDKKSVIFIFKGLEDLVICFEKNRSTFFIGIADNFKLAFGNAAFETLFVNVFAVAYFNFKPFGKGVNYGSADAMKTAGNFIAGTAELTACMKNGENNSYCRNAKLCMDTNGDSSAVIRYTDKVSGKNFNIDIGAIARKGFVDCVVDNFINKVMTIKYTLDLKFADYEATRTVHVTPAETPVIKLNGNTTIDLKKG